MWLLDNLKLMWLVLYFYCQHCSKCCHLLGSVFDPPFFLYSCSLIQFYGFKQLIYANTYTRLFPEFLTCASNGLLNFSAWKPNMHLILALPLASPISCLVFLRDSLGVIFDSFLSIVQMPQSFLPVGLYSNYIQNLIIFHYNGA